MATLLLLIKYKDCYVLSQDVTKWFVAEMTRVLQTRPYNYTFAYNLRTKTWDRTLQYPLQYDTFTKSHKRNLGNTDAHATCAQKLKVVQVGSERWNVFLSPDAERMTVIDQNNDSLVNNVSMLPIAYKEVENDGVLALILHINHETDKDTLILCFSTTREELKKTTL